jgi:4-amino-4-deoxy-L-arabinose transferase-like glycosyltransferase
MVVLLAISLSWATIVDLTPADQRPYVGSSGDNSELSLIVGYNGLERLLGMGRSSGAGFAGRNNFPQFRNGAPPVGNGFPAPGNPPQGNRFQGRPGGNFGGGFTGGPNGNGRAGPLRLITGPLAREASWLLPFGLVGLLLLFLARRWTWPLSSQQQAGVLWGGWLLTGMAFFSVAGFFHEYYLSMLGAPLAALVGIAAVEIWRICRKWIWLGAALLIGAAGVTLILQSYIAGTVVGTISWQPLVIELFTLGVVVVLGAAMFKWQRISQAGYGLVIAALLVTPGVWSGLTNRYATANDEAKKLVDPAILNDPTVFVPDEAFANLEGAHDVSSDPLRVEIWEEFVSSVGG